MIVEANGYLELALRREHVPGNTLVGTLMASVWGFWALPGAALGDRSSDWP